MAGMVRKERREQGVVEEGEWEEKKKEGVCVFGGGGEEGKKRGKVEGKVCGL